MDAGRPQVRILGGYSPVLTWLKYRRLPSTTVVVDWVELKARALTVFEVGVIAAWTLYVGQELLVIAPERWPHGGEFAMSTQGHFMWRQLLNCGPCFFWNGSTNGGVPSFVDVHGSSLHPLTSLATLLFYVTNGAKVILLGAFLMAGLGQWWLGRVLGLRRLPRVWGALMVIASGHLAGRMESGNVPLVLSTAAVSLTIPPALDLALRGRRRSAIALGLTLGLAALSGQGYMQIGLLLSVAPGLLVILLNHRPRLHLSPMWMEFALALGLAGLVAAPMLIPLGHFWTNLGKDSDPLLRSAQPFFYSWLNLIINDPDFYWTEALGKQPFPYLYINYIGLPPMVLEGAALSPGGHGIHARTRSGSGSRLSHDRRCDCNR